MHACRLRIHELRPERVCLQPSQSSHSQRPQHCSLFQTAIIKNKLLENACWEPVACEWLCSTTFKSHIYISCCLCTTGCKIDISLLHSAEMKDIPISSMSSPCWNAFQTTNCQQMWTLLEKLSDPSFWLLARQLKYVNAQMSNAHLPGNSQQWRMVSVLSKMNCIQLFAL